MTTRLTTRIRRPRRRSVLAAVLAGPLLLSATACEVTTNVRVSCDILGPVDQTIRSVTTPDQARPGDIVHQDLGIAVPSSPLATMDGLVVRSMLVTLPVPPQIEDVTIDLNGGALTGYSVRDGDVFVINVSGSAPLRTSSLPIIGMTGRVKADAAGHVDWPMYRSLILEGTVMGGSSAIRCAPVQAGLLVNRQAVNRPAVTTTTTRTPTSWQMTSTTTTTTWRNIPGTTKPTATTTTTTTAPTSG